MAQAFTLDAKARAARGKAEARRMRRLRAEVPAIIYGGSKDPVAISINQFSFDKALKNEAFYSHILTLAVDGKAEKVILRDLQRHPSKEYVMHADFMRVSANEKLTMTIPLHFVGDDTCPGVEVDNGSVSHLMNEVEIRCLPKDLPEYIEVDCSQMQLNDTIHLSDLKLPKGVELVALSHSEDHDLPVVNVHTVAEYIEEEPEAAESAEVPVIGEEQAKGGTAETDGEEKSDKE